MRSLPAFLLAILSVSVSAADYRSEQLVQAAQLRDSVVPGAAHAIVESLTTEVGPRMAGTEADMRAVNWARAKFAALGFDEVRIEPVKFPLWTRGREHAEVIAPYPQPLRITALGGSIGTGEQPLQAEVVMFDTLADLQAAADGSLSGKIAFINGRMERFRDGRGYGPAVAQRGNGASEAAKKGALAVVIRSVGTDLDRFPHTGQMRYAEGVTRIPAAALSVPDANLLQHMIQRGQPVTLALDIGAELRGEGLSYNVIGDIRGRSKPEEVVVIGGHLDSWDLGTGAIDDGAGVGITMAAGAAILAHAQRPLRTVRVIAWANEEQGLHGANTYAAAHAKEITQHILGAESDFGAGRVYALRAGVSTEYQSRFAQIAEVLAPLGIPYEPTGGGAGPDVGPLVVRGMPWAQLAQDGTDYFDTHHTANDVLERIDSAALDQQVAAYAVLAWMAADAPSDFGRVPPPVVAK